MSKLIITVAMTGAETGKDVQPNLPITPEEIGIAAAECAKAGAAMVHLHGRFADGTPTQDAATYQEIIREVRARCDLIIQVSTGGAVGMTAQERLAPVGLVPEMATLSMGTVNFGDDVFMNAPKDMAEFLAEMKERGVKPEFEIFDAGHLHTLQRWVKKGLVPGTPHVDLVLGVPGAMNGTPESLMYLRSQLPEGATWSVAGVGAAQLPLGVMAIAMGGHVRTGFEDNIYFRKGELARSNAQLVDRIAQIARLMDRPPATPDEARAMLGLPARH